MLKIFGVPISVHTRKVIVAALAKGLPHEVVPVGQDCGIRVRYARPVSHGL